MSSPERNVPKNYRPPSPEWISRAGGVAIMKKKSIVPEVVSGTKDILSRLKLKSS